MRKVTTISLDEKTAVIAKSLPNFSHFVRECLLRHHAASMNQDDCPFNKVERFGERCVPRVQHRPHCFVCWPNGKPSEQLVKNYLAKYHKDGDLHGAHLLQLDEATKIENWQLLNIDQNITVQESGKEPSNGGVKGNLLTRFKRFLSN